MYDVLVLEKGRQLFDGLGSGDAGAVGVPFANDEVGTTSHTAPFAQDPLLEPRSFRRSPSAGPRTVVGEVNTLPTTVGGGTVHWDAKARRFREIDFVANSALGGGPERPAVAGTTYADWPVQYRHLEAFYAVMEEVAGVQGPAWRDAGGAVVNPNPLESWRSTPFPMPPGVAMYSNLFLADAARRLGLHPAPVPTAITSRPYHGRPACDDCAFCGGYGCSINAKGGGVWVLHEALRTGRCTLRSEARALRVDHDAASGAGGRRHASSVTWIDSNGRLHTDAADLVVLACSPIEAVRLSLRSGIGAAPDEADLGTLRATDTDPSGLLGRNLMFHLQTVVFGLFDEDIHPHRGRTSTHCIDDFAGSGPSAAHADPAVLRGGILELGGNQDPVGEATTLSQLVLGGPLKDAMRVSPFRRHLAALTLQGEDMPQLQNVVDLDPQIVDIAGEPVPRITYDSHDYEKRAQAHYLDRMTEIMHAVGGPGSAYPDLSLILTAPSPPDAVPSSRHIMGTHRMAVTPAGGPCDPFGRYWAFDNLYHAGGGLFVTAPGYNPTLTIWALAYWVAAAIVAGVGGRPAYAAADIDTALGTLHGVIRRLDPGTMIAGVLSRPGGGAPPPS